MDVLQQKFDTPLIPHQIVEVPMKQSNFEFNGDKYENQMVFQIWYPRNDIRNPEVDKKVSSNL